MSIQLLVESPRVSFEGLTRGSPRDKATALEAFRRFVEQHTESVHLDYSVRKAAGGFDLSVWGLNPFDRLIKNNKPEWMDAVSRLVYLPATDETERFSFRFSTPFPGGPLTLDVGELNSLTEVVEWAANAAIALPDEERDGVWDTVGLYGQAIKLARKENCIVFVSV